MILGPDGTPAKRDERTSEREAALTLRGDCVACGKVYGRAWVPEHHDELRSPEHAEALLVRAIERAQVATTACCSAGFVDLTLTIGPAVPDEPASFFRVIAADHHVAYIRLHDGGMRT